MKRFFYKNRYGLTLMLVLALVLQIVGPIVLEYVYAGEEGKEEAEAFEEMEALVEDEDDTSDDEINAEENQVQPTDEEGEKSDEAEDVKETEKPQEKSQPKAKAAPTPLSGGNKIEDSIIDEFELKKGYGYSWNDYSAFEDGELIDHTQDLGLRIEWSLPDDHEYEGGDYFEFNLPKQLTVHNPISGSLGEMGSYTVDMNGKVTLIFNDNITSESNINGDFWFGTNLDEKEIISTEETITFVNRKDEEKVFVINIKPKGGQAINKQGQPDGGNFNAERIKWTVLINTTRESLEDAVITDPILGGDGHTLDISSIILNEIEVDFIGEKVEGLEKNVENITNESNDKELKIKLGDTNKAYELIFETEMSNEEKGKEGTTTYSNTAYLNSDGKPQASSGASVSISRPKSITKFSTDFNLGDRSVEWTVNVNFNKKALAEGTAIVDKFTFKVGGEEIDDVFEVKEANIEIYKVTEFNTNGTVKESKKLSSNSETFDITINGNEVTYKLKNDTSDAFIIKYKTTVKKGAYIHKNGTITNSVNLEGKTATSSKNITQQVGKKTHKPINYQDKTIEWTIIVNADKQNLGNFILEDNFSGSGQKLVEDSIAINPDIDGDNITINQDNEGFKIDFDDINEKYVITYKTKFTYDFTGENKPNFKNTAKFKYEIEGEENEYELEIPVTITPNNQTKNNGAKNSLVDQDTKEITWMVDINYNQLELTDAKIVDMIEKNQSLIEDSIKVYKTTIESNGNVTPGDEVTDNLDITTVVDQDQDEIQVVFNGEINESYRLVFKTKDKDDIYNEDEIYKNTALFIPTQGEEHKLKASATLPNQGDFLEKRGTHNKTDWTIDWEVDVNKSKSRISNVKVMDDLGDTDAQILLEDTIKIIRVSSNEELEESKDYNLVVEDNKLTIEFIGEITDHYKIKYSSYIVAEESMDIGNNVMVESSEKVVGITEKVEIVKFQISTGGGSASGETGGLIIDKTEKVSNRKLKDVEFKLIKQIGEKQIVVREGLTDEDGKLEWNGLKYGEYILEETIPEGYEKMEPQTIEISGDDSEGVKILNISNKRKTGIIKIIKVDSITGETLEGAKFKIKNETTGAEYEFTTNGNGEISEEIQFGEYIIEEIIAPDGYEVKNDIPNITIEIDSETEIKVKNIPTEIPRGNIKAIKKWIGGPTVKPTIEIQLYRNGEALGEPVKLANGVEEYIWKDLELGNAEGEKYIYTVDEVRVPSNYKKSISEDGLEVTNRYIPPTPIGRDSLELIKLGEDGEFLAGAVFELLQNGKVVKTSVPTDSDGKVVFNDLNYGTYTVKEKTAPEGYKLGITTQEIIISTGGEIKTLEFTNAKVKGSIKLIKVDEKGKFLKGAEFSLYNLDGELVGKASSDKNGVVIFTNIPYGEYTVTEIEAPEGYKLNDKIYKVSIEEDGTVVDMDIDGESLMVENIKIPTDPIDPTDPEDPDSTDPIDPTDPNEQGKPGEPGKPGQPGGSGEIGDPTDPNESGQPGNSTDPINPKEPVDSTDPKGNILAKTGSNIDFFIPIGFVMILVGVAYIYRDRLIKR